MLGGPDACIDSNAASVYLNTPAVQKALHVEVREPASSSAPGITVTVGTWFACLQDASQFWQKWIICSNKLHYTPTAANLPRDVYPELIKELDVVIFNGDADACVPYTDNEEWTSGMGFSVAEAWHPWLVDQQVAGYVTKYQTSGNGGFRFMTVKGAGHSTLALLRLCSFGSPVSAQWCHSTSPSKRMPCLSGLSQASHFKQRLHSKCYVPKVSFKCSERIAPNADVAINCLPLSTASPLTFSVRLMRPVNISEHTVHSVVQVVLYFWWVYMSP